MPLTHSRILKCATIVCLTALSITSLSAAVVYTPDADSYVQKGTGGSAENTNYGTATSFQVRHSDNSEVRRLGYVRFDISNQIGNDLSTATVSFVLSSISSSRTTASTIEVYGLNANYVASSGDLGLDWGETDLTNANAPWSAPTVAPPSYVTLLGSFAVPATGGASAGTVFSVSTPELATFLNSLLDANTGYATFILKETTIQPNVITFTTKENTSYASSSLALTVVPEPSTVALLGAGLVLLLVRIRRQLSI